MRGESSNSQILSRPLLSDPTGANSMRATATSGRYHPVTRLRFLLMLPRPMFFSSLMCLLLSSARRHHRPMPNLIYVAARSSSRKCFSYGRSVLGLERIVVSATSDAYLSHEHHMMSDSLTMLIIQMTMQCFQFGNVNVRTHVNVKLL